jgi:hypothetical protein
MTDHSHIKHRNFLLPTILVAAIIMVIAIFYYIGSDPCSEHTDAATKDNCYLIQLETDWNNKWCKKIENEEMATLCSQKHRSEMRLRNANKKDDRPVKERLLERKQKEELRRQIKGEAPDFEPDQQLIFGEDGVIRAK